MHWFIDPIKYKYADFSGRTNRQEYWMFILIYIVVGIIVSIVEGIIGTTFLYIILSLALLVPSIAIAARRLHDIGKSGWWQLIVIIPIIGWIILIVWLASKSYEGVNAYGARSTALVEEATPAPEPNPLPAEDMNDGGEAKV